MECTLRLRRLFEWRDHLRLYDDFTPARPPQAEERVLFGANWRARFGISLSTEDGLMFIAILTDADSNRDQRQNNGDGGIAKQTIMPEQNRNELVPAQKVCRAARLSKNRLALPPIAPPLYKHFVRFARSATIGWRRNEWLEAL